MAADAQKVADWPEAIDKARLWLLALENDAWLLIRSIELKTGTLPHPPCTCIWYPILFVEQTERVLLELLCHDEVECIVRPKLLQYVRMLFHSPLDKSTVSRASIDQREKELPAS